MFQPGQGMQHARRRGDGVGGEDQIDPGEVSPHNQAPGRRLGAVDGPVLPRREMRRGDGVRRDAVRHLGGLAEGMAGVQRGDVGGGEFGMTGEPLVEPIDGRLPVAVVHPVDQAEGVQILAAQRVLPLQPATLDRLHRQLRNVDGDDAEIAQRPVLERIPLEPGLAQVLLRQTAGIDDHHAARLEIPDLDRQRRRVERDEDVGGVARGLDIAGAEIDLEGGNTVGGPGRGADFGGKIGKSGEVIAGKRGGVGEAPPRHLDAVTGISGETDDDALHLLAGRTGQVYRGISCHGPTLSDRTCVPGPQALLTANNANFPNRS